MDIQAIKEDFQAQLKQEAETITELNQKLQQAQQHALKLQGAVEALTLVIDNTVAPEEIVDDFATGEIVETAVVKTPNSRKKQNPEFN
jgi:hypothetical protein